MVESIPRIPPVELLHVTSVRYAGDYKLQLRFSDGVQGIVDLRERLSAPVFESLRNPSFFARVYLQDGYTVAWSNDLDFAPEFLYDQLEVTGPVAKRDYRKAFDDNAREAVVQSARMPEICRFFGIVIRMFWVEHAKPHFHAQYAEAVATIRIGDGSVETHGFPPRALRLVEEWRELHTRELLDNWDRMRRHEPPQPIAPLE
jgi:hypothetical protein